MKLTVASGVRSLPARWADKAGTRTMTIGRAIVAARRTAVMLAVGVLATQLMLLVLAGPLVLAAAQPAEKMPRVGYISPGSPSDPVRLRRFEGFREAMRELGYAEGRNLSLEPRWAGDQYDRYTALAADLVRLKADIIVTLGGAATPSVDT